MAQTFQISIGQIVSLNGESHRVMEFYYPGRNLARKFVIENLRTGCRKCVFKHQLDFEDSDDDMLVSVPDVEDDQTTTPNNIPTVAATETLRFANVEETQLDEIARSRNERSTEMSTKWAVKIFKEWLHTSNLPAEFEMQTDAKLNHLLRRFYAEVRTKTGKEYSKSALTSIRAAINRHLTSPPFERQINIMHDKAFMTSNHIFAGVVKGMKRAGKDVTRHHDAISDGDVQKMYSTGTLSNDSPVSLIRKVWFEITLHFGRRGAEGLKLLRADSFQLARDDTGAEYFRMAYNESDKTHHGLDSRENDKQPRMYATNVKNCPVESLKLYLDKRNKANESFFQRPLTSPKADCWYSQQPMGENTLKKMMSIISSVAGLSQTYTNHCVRATTATKLSEAGVGALGIMSVTGHRNEQSLKSYITTPSVSQRKAFSNILQSSNTTSALPAPCCRPTDVVSRCQVTAAQQYVAESSSVSCYSTSSTATSYQATPFRGLQLLQAANITGGNVTFNFFDGKKSSSSVSESE